MKTRLLFLSIALLVVMGGLVLTQQVFAEQVTCSGPVKNINMGGWTAPVSSSGVTCFRFSLAGGKNLNISLKSPGGKYHYFLAQGKNVTSLNERISLRPTNPGNVQNSQAVPNRAAGDYVLAVKPIDGSGSFTLRISQIDIPSSQPEGKACSDKDPCRGKADVGSRAGQDFLGTEPNASASLIIPISCPGKIIVETRWTQGPSEMRIEVYGSRKAFPPVSGTSPLRVEYNLTRGDLDLSNPAWAIVLTNFQGGNHDVSLTYETPANYCVPSGQETLRKLTLESGVDRKGEDYRYVETSDALACRAMCADDIRCASFTFSHNDRTCYLKSAVPQPSRNANTTSGVVAIRVFPLKNGIDYYGFDYPSKQAEQAKNQEDCRRACIEDLHCVSFTFETQSRICYLKYGIPQSSSCSTCISGAAIYRQATVELRTDRLGGDYEHRLLMEKKAEACRLACANDPRCKAYTYSTDGVCHLKDSVPPPSKCNTCTSGVVQARTFSYEDNIDRQQSDYWWFENPMNEVEICRLACAQDLRCITYVYKRPGYQGPNAICFLKAQTPGQTGDNCCVSGVAGK